MGIYTTNTHSSLGAASIDVAALEGYNATTGCTMALIESVQNDLALFNGTIMSDMQEVASVNEGVEVINESAKDVFKKIGEIFVKLLAKLKGIFKAFIAKLSGVLSSNKGLYDKYKGVISKNTNWKDFKIKNYRKMIKDINTVSEYIPSNYTIKRGCADFSIEDITKEGSDITVEDINTNLVTKLSRDINTEVNTENFDNLTKVLMDACFEAAEDKDDWSVGDILHGAAGDILVNGDKMKGDIEKANDKMEKDIAKAISNIEKISADMTTKASNQRLGKSVSDTGKSYVGTDGKLGKDTKIEGSKLDTYEKVAQFCQRVASQEQALITKLTAARISAVKFEIAQARRVWSSAAAFASVEHKNEGYEFYTAIGESAEYDFYSDFDAPVVA